MTFNSLSYFLFLPASFLVFYCSAERWRWLVLLAASYGFYASFTDLRLLLALLAVTAVSYGCGVRLSGQRDEALRKRWLWGGVSTCVLVLALFKYFRFFEGQANHIFGLNSHLSETIVTVGISYFTLQAISYLADVYLEIREPEQHAGHFALYLSFFPKLLQGPIERADDLLPQLKQPYRFDYEAVRSGLLLFAWGLYKKIVLADRFAIYADQVYNNVHSYTGLSLILGTYAYAFQIYFDFSGYTDMARGSARIFGINLTENFNSPYLATSIAEFWRRWHISFSRFILDYIFKPLQMAWRRVGEAGTAAALVITFLVSGIWHGATWGFVIWGLLHGIYLASSTLYRPYQKRMYKALQVEKSKLLKWWQAAVTFNLVNLAWIFFRANTVADAWYVVTNLSSGFRGFLSQVVLPQGKYDVMILVMTVTIYLLLKRHVLALAARKFYCRWAVYLLLALCCQLLYVSSNSFIYFGF